jgi:hypothetical protein
MAYSNRHVVHFHQRNFRTAAAAVLAAAGLVTSLSAQVGPIEQSPVGPIGLFRTMNPDVEFIEEDGGISRIYGPAFATGFNPTHTADSFLRNYADMLRSDFAQLLPIGPNAAGEHAVPLGYDEATDSYRFTLVGYTQHVKGIPVFRSDIRCLVRNEPNYPLVLVSNGLKDIRDFAAKFGGKAIAPSRLNLKRASQAPLNQFGPGAEISEQEQVIWAGYEDIKVAEPRVAYKFVVSGTGVFDKGIDQRILFVVDAETNKILFQEDQIVHANVPVSVRGMATTGLGAAECAAEAERGLPYAALSAGGVTYYADVNGNFTVPNASASAIAVTSSLLTGGRYFRVNDLSPLSESSITQSSAGAALVFTHNAANADESDRAEVNAYIHANIVRDFVLQHAPGFPTIATQTGFPINVQIGSSCNAFYDGASINFYAAGGGCTNTAASTIVYHEYGHHVVACGGSGQGEYGEGFSDALSAVLTDDPGIGYGFQSCAAPLRTANNTVQYSATGCSSAGSAIHACGQLFSGSVWSIRNRLAATNPSSYRTIVGNLLVDSVLLHRGTSITPALTVDWLTLNDNDGNILNGTPNYNEIRGGFADHGLVSPPVKTVLWASAVPETSNPASVTPWTNETWVTFEPACVNCNQTSCQYATNQTNGNTTPLTATDFANYALPVGHRITKVEVEVLGRYNTGTTANIGFRAWSPGHPVDSGWRNTANFTSATNCEPRCRTAGDITALSSNWTPAMVNALRFQVRRKAGLTNNTLRIVGMKVTVSSAPY